MDYQRKKESEAKYSECDEGEAPHVVCIRLCLQESILPCVFHLQFQEPMLTGVYILQMTRILFPGRPDHAPKIFAIEGSPTPPN